jgi:hypothetical protein
VPPVRLALAAVAFTLGLGLASGPALAQEGDEERRLDSDASQRDDEAPRPKKKKKVVTAEEEMTEEKAPEKLASLDEPHIGLSAELAFTLALLDKTYGPGPVPAPSIGLRVDWAVGRLWTDPSDEFWKYALLAELAYDYSTLSGGTQQVNTTTTFHYLNLRALMGYPVKDYLLFYGALGAGFTVEHVAYDVLGTDTPLNGVKPDFDYGVGARARFAINPSLAISARAELMRIRRAYLDDTFITLSGGVDF